MWYHSRILERAWSNPLPTGVDALNLPTFQLPGKHFHQAVALSANISEIREVTRPHPAAHGGTEETAVGQSLKPVSGGSEGADCGPQPIQTPVIIADPEIPNSNLIAFNRCHLSFSVPAFVLDYSGRILARILDVPTVVGSLDVPTVVGSFRFLVLSIPRRS